MKGWWWSWWHLQSKTIENIVERGFWYSAPELLAWGLSDEKIWDLKKGVVGVQMNREQRCSCLFNTVAVSWCWWWVMAVGIFILFLTWHKVQSRFIYSVTKVSRYILYPLTNLQFFVLFEPLPIALLIGCDLNTTSHTEVPSIQPLTVDWNISDG